MATMGDWYLRIPRGMQRDQSYSFEDLVDLFPIKEQRNGRFRIKTVIKQLVDDGFLTKISHVYNKDEYFLRSFPTPEEDSLDFRCKNKRDRGIFKSTASSSTPKSTPIMPLTPEPSEPPQSAFAALAEMLMIIKTQQDEILNRLQAQHV